MVHIKKTFYIWYRKYWHLVQGKMAKKIVFGSDFMIYGAPFYKWCRFTYGAVTNDVWEKREARPILIILNYKYTRNIHYFNISLSYIFFKTRHKIPLFSNHIASTCAIRAACFSRNVAVSFSKLPNVRRTWNSYSNRFVVWQDGSCANDIPITIKRKPQHDQTHVGAIFNDSVKVSQ